MRTLAKTARLALGLPLVLLVGACPYSTEQPLYPIDGAALDASLTGAWRCLEADPGSTHSDDKVARVTFTPFDAHQYAVSMEATGEDLGLLRAHATKLKDARLLSIQSLGGDDKPSWSLVRYTFVDGDLLRLRFVGDKLLKDDKGEKAPAEARALIEKNLETADLYEAGYVCVRVPPKS